MELRLGGELEIAPELETEEEVRWTGEVEGQVTLLVEAVPLVATVTLGPLFSRSKATSNVKLPKLLSKEELKLFARVGVGMELELGEELGMTLEVGMELDDGAIDKYVAFAGELVDSQIALWARAVSLPTVVTLVALFSCSARIKVKLLPMPSEEELEFTEGNGSMGTISREAVMLEAFPS